MADLEPFVTLVALANWMKAPTYASDITVKDILQEVLNAAMENVESRVGPLVSAERAYLVRASGRCLVLPETHLSSVGAVTAPDGTVFPAEQLDVNLLSGIVTVPVVARGQWTVLASTREHADSLSLAVKIIAAHLWETQRGSPAGGSSRFGLPTTDGAPIRMGFAIPARAAELIAPFLRTV